MPVGRVLCFTHFALQGCQDIEPDTSELLLSWCPLSFALSQSQSLQRRGCPETPPCWVWLGQDPIKPGGEGGHPRPWLQLAMISEPILKKTPDLIWAGSPPWKLPLVWLLLPGTGRAGSGSTQAGESSGKGTAVVGWVGEGGVCADSHAPGADGTLFYVWPQWIMSAKLLEAYNMEGSHRNIVNRNSKIH